MTVTQAKKENIKKAIAVLEQGGLVIFPTETTYGAGVDASNPEAVKKLLAYKSRREGKPLSIAVPDKKSASKYVELNEQAEKLYGRFLPGPYTIVSKDKGRLAPGVASEFGTVGIRIPDYPFLLELLQAYGKAITATSANASGKKRPYTINDILQNLSAKQKNLIDLIIDAGELPKNEPSTVIDTTLSTPLTLRSRTSDTQQAGTSFFSRSEEETMSLAGKLLLKHWNEIKKSGLVIGLSGALGTGKTIFAKGVGRFLQIEEEIASPTYGYIENYNFERHGVKGVFSHLDLWKVDSKQELERLEIGELLKPQSVTIIEWWDQVADWMDIKPKILIEIKEKNSERNLTVFEPFDRLRAGSVKN